MGCLLKILKCVVVCIMAAILILVVIGWCSRLPTLEGRPASAALFDTDYTRLGNSISPKFAAHPGPSGIYPLADSPDAVAFPSVWEDPAAAPPDPPYSIL